MLHQSDLVSQEIRDKMMITLSMQYIHIMNDTISTWVNNHLDVMTNICYVNFGFANVFATSFGFVLEHSDAEPKLFISGSFSPPYSGSGSFFPPYFGSGSSFSLMLPLNKWENILGQCKSGAINAIP